VLFIAVCTQIPIKFSILWKLFKIGPINFNYSVFEMTNNYINEHIQLIQQKLLLISRSSSHDL
jgi:hypothetical protein